MCDPSKSWAGSPGDDTNNFDFSTKAQSYNLLITRVGQVYLQKGNLEDLKKLENKLKIPYQNDPMLYIKEQLFRNLWVKNNKTALRLLLHIVIYKPWQPKSFYIEVLSTLKNNIIKKT